PPTASSPHGRDLRSTARTAHGRLAPAPPPGAPTRSRDRTPSASRSKRSHGSRDRSYLGSAGATARPDPDQEHPELPPAAPARAREPSRPDHTRPGVAAARRR